MPWTVRMTLFVFTIAAPFAVYTCWKAVGAGVRLIPTVWVRWATISLAGWWCLYPLLLMTAYFFGITALSRLVTTQRTFTDWLLVYPFWTGAVVFAQIAPLLLILDVIRFSQSLFRANWTPWSAAEPILILSLLIATAGFVIYKIYSDTCGVRINVADLEIDDLPAELDGFRIVHVSDLQADSRTTPGRQAQYVEAVNSLDPDMVLFSGDLVTNGTTYIDEGAESLGKMKDLCLPRRSRYLVGRRSDHHQSAAQWNPHCAYRTSATRCGRGRTESLCSHKRLQRPSGSSGIRP